MYTFSNRLRITSFILMAVGILGIGIGFVSAPSSVEEAKAMIASHDDGHGDTHAEVPGMGAEVEHGNMADHGTDHDEHLLHQLQNRPWAALYVAALFFFIIALGVLAFYAIQRAAQAGWSPMLFRVMEGITAYLVPGGIIVFVLLVLSVLHLNHLFVWMDPEVVEHDELLQGKASYLNPVFFLIRAAIFLVGWILYREVSRRLSLAQDKADDNSNFKKNFRWSAGFLVFYLVSESMMSWDWIMSVDPHWFSTLFGWYVFASMFVSGITVIAMIAIYLKSRGYLPDVNDSHIHDLAKFMFGISIFWAYLWFGQFMLIWYANIPEETGWFLIRQTGDWKWVGVALILGHFALPFFLLLSRFPKRRPGLLAVGAIYILAVHFIDLFWIVQPQKSPLGHMPVPLLDVFLCVAMIGLYVVFTAKSLQGAALIPTGDPRLAESLSHENY